MKNQYYFFVMTFTDLYADTGVTTNYGIVDLKNGVFGKLRHSLPSALTAFLEPDCEEEQLRQQPDDLPNILMTSCPAILFVEHSQVYREPKNDPNFSYKLYTFSGVKLLPYEYPEYFI